MARRKARIPQGKKIQPAVKTMAFNMPVFAVNYIDLSQCASILNRRFYRQGLNWAVAGFTFFTAGEGSINISKIPDTWVASNAWTKAFASWQKMNDDALEETESVKPKFLDFKVYMDSLHHIAGSGANLLPLDADSTPAGAGEWNYSSIHVPYATDTTTAGSLSMREFDLIWTGASFPGVSPATTNDAASLIEGYAASRGLPDVLDPNTPADFADTVGGTPQNWMAAMFNEGTTQDHEVLEDMISENNQAPYPYEGDGTAVDTQYPGGANQLPGLEVHDTLLVTSTTVGGKTTSHGANFQGGLIRIDTDISAPISADTGVACLVHLVPGPHRGYMCQKMQDV